MTENSRNYHTPSHIFEIKHNEISNAQFDELRQDMNILYGYHGSRVENFYSILNNGLHAHLNKVHCIFRTFIQCIHTFLKREIVRLTVCVCICV